MSCLGAVGTRRHTRKSSVDGLHVANETPVAFITVYFTPVNKAAKNGNPAQSPLRLLYVYPIFIRCTLFRVCFCLVPHDSMMLPWTYGIQGMHPSTCKDMYFCILHFLSCFIFKQYIHLLWKCTFCYILL